jgi:hypothetical protein
LILVDVNVLVYAWREDAERHAAFAAWLNEAVDGDEPIALSDGILSGFVRVVTNPRIFARPTSTAEALGFADTLRDQPNAVVVAPGSRHWGIFRRLCLAAGAKGNLIPDAFLAALAIEAGCVLATTDRDFARFDGLRWRHPLDS